MAAMNRAGMNIAVTDALMLVGVLTFMGTLLDKRAAVRLTAALHVDSSAIRSRLGWTPPYSMEAGLAATVAAAK